MAVPICIPWRSVWLPRAVTAVALVVGLPLFLRSPPWCDITLYQMAARNLLHGGAHYRDLFDTNLPGFVWVTTALYALFGPNVIAVRVLDLLIVTGVVAIIDRLAKWSGATPAARWWAIAATALFYPFTVEMSHAQRDTWMALPGLAAVALRVRRGLMEPTPPAPLSEGKGESEAARGLASSPSRASREAASGSDARSSAPFRRSFYEGLLWGAGVWIKPHIALMALGVWLLTARRLAGEHPRPWRAACADLLGNLLGGLAVGVPGVLWLAGSGAWKVFLEVFLEWNPWYMKLAQHEFQWRVQQELFWFPPWSLGLIPTAVLALLSVRDMSPWSSRAAAHAGPDDAAQRRSLAMLVVLLLALVAPGAFGVLGKVVANGADTTTFVVSWAAALLACALVRPPACGAWTDRRAYRLLFQAALIAAWQLAFVLWGWIALKVYLGVAALALLGFCWPTFRRWLPAVLWDKRASPDARFVRGTLGGLYLVWAAQTLFIQRGFQYAHLPETLLMLAVWASHRWAWVLLVLLWLAVTSGAWLVADSQPGMKADLDALGPKARDRYLPRHPITIAARLRLWPECWRPDLSDAERYALWDKLRLHPPHEASIGWEEIAEVADFFRTVKRADGGTGVRDGEVIAWFDSPHAVYLLLDLKPGFRFMHVYTAISISCGVDESGEIGRKRVLQELKDAPEAPGVTYYTITDLEWVALVAGEDMERRAQFLGPARNPPADLLPLHTPYPDEFPFNQPTVFRTRNGTGRYIVHKIVTRQDDRK